jgi:predicted RNase H-like HicB family nuclease
MSSRQSIRLTFAITAEPPYFVSECKELGVASCGDTREKALTNLKEAVLLYLETLEEYGERQQVLAKAGVAILLEDMIICSPGGSDYTALLALPVSDPAAQA